VVFLISPTLAGMTDPGKKLREFVADDDIRTLNVAGPRASKEPEVGDFVRGILEEAFLKEEKTGTRIFRE